MRQDNGGNRRVLNRVDGHQIELFVSDQLRSRGFVVLEQNYKVGHLEVDIIALEGDILCFIEVKARRRPFVLSEINRLIPREKRRNIITVSDAYCRRLKGVNYANVRFDYALVYLPDGVTPKRVQYIRNAFVPTYTCR